MNRNIKYTDFFELVDGGDNIAVAALFMTYGFDAELFEHHILPAFLNVVDNPIEQELRFRNQIALKLKEIPVGVISDAAQYNGGRTFLYDHIVVKQDTFHPKCYMILFKDFLRVIISSSNITKPGLCYNAELIWHEDIYLDKVNSISYDLKSILDFVKDRYELENMAALCEIQKYLDKCKFKTSYPKLISTCEEKFVLDRVMDELKNCSGNCRSVTIMSPFFENDREEIEKSLIGSFIKRIKSIYKNTKINICFPANEQGDKYIVNAPANIFDEVSKEKNVSFLVVHREWEREDEEPITRNLHAKLIYAKFDNGYNLYMTGSINFTNNAMRSNKANLKNMEIGVINYTTEELIIPNCRRVGIDALEFIDNEKIVKKSICFIDKAEYNNQNLKIYFDEKNMVLPCKIYYNDKVLLSLDSKINEKIVDKFKLKRSQDLKVECDDFIFYVPISISNKEDIITEDLKLDFNITVEDIIDYLAGKYKSMSELKRVKALVKNEKQDQIKETTIYFKQNLHYFYKALSSLKQGLELPYYSELAFDNYISAPIGIKNLIKMFLDDYKDKNSSEVETFLFLVEILNVVNHLQFSKDWLDEGYKMKKLEDITKEAKLTIKQIVKKSKRTLKNQYYIMLKAYDLEVKKW